METDLCLVMGYLGLIKFITSGGFFIWWIVDILTAAKRAKQWNINRLHALANDCVTSSSKEKIEALKNNKELQKAIIDGVKDVSKAAKDLHNTMYLD